VTTMPEATATFPGGPPADPADDALLAQRVAAGDRDAFAHLMRRYNRRLYRLARATLRDDADAEDALQDAYLLAFLKIDQYRGEATLSTWLSRLVLNECLGRLRRSARRDTVVQMISPADDSDVDSSTMTDPRPESPDQSAIRAEVRSLLERKLDQLPQAYRTVFVLRAVEELSVEETAASLGVPEATVRSRHFRARSMLRESLARDFDLSERDVFDFGGSHCDRIVATMLKRLPGA
jgi:RNA polymerase sigma-70 factor, ECF subfamily